MALPLPDPADPVPGRGPRRVIDGDEGLVRRHLRGVWRFARLLGGRAEEADELTQETFLVALEKGAGTRGDAETGAWLRGITRNLFLRRREKDGRRAHLLAGAAEALWQRTSAGDHGDGAVAALRSCLDSLPERTRRALEWTHGEGASREVVARRLGLRPNGVKTLLQCARAVLRECVERRMR